MCIAQEKLGGRERERERERGGGGGEGKGRLEKKHKVWKGRRGRVERVEGEVGGGIHTCMYRQQPYLKGISA